MVDYAGLKAAWRGSGAKCEEAMGRIADMTGMKTGILEVLWLSQNRRPGKRRVRMWRCRCECGRELDIDGAALRSRNTQSCGCLRKFVAEYLDKPREANGRFKRIYSSAPIEPPAVL